MIRIETSEGLGFMTLVLSGHIQTDDLPELKRVMESYGQPVVLDLRGVKLIDRDTVRFLADFDARNGSITSCPSYIREWIHRERAER